MMTLLHSSKRKHVLETERETEKTGTDLDIVAHANPINSLALNSLDEMPKQHTARHIG